MIILLWRIKTIALLQDFDHLKQFCLFTIDVLNLLCKLFEKLFTFTTACRRVFPSSSTLETISGFAYMRIFKSLTFPVRHWKWAMLWLEYWQQYITSTLSIFSSTFFMLTTLLSHITFRMIIRWVNAYIFEELLGFFTGRRLLIRLVHHIEQIRAESFQPIPLWTAPFRLCDGPAALL